MIKKKMIAAFVAAVGVLGGSAQAAFVKYDPNTVTFNDGSVASGYFYPDTSNNAIVYYRIEITGAASASMANFSLSGKYNAVSESSRSFAGAGPSNFAVFDNLTDFYFQRLNLNFSPSTSQGVFNVFGSQSQQPIPDLPAYANGFSAQRNIVSGTTSLGLADANVIFSLESGVRDFAVIIPAPFRSNVPEPNSMTLVGMGLVGLIAARRKRK